MRGCRVVAEPGVYIASVDQLIDTFRQGLLALIPVAERAQIAWREPEAYDEWDALAECLYKVFVSDSAGLPTAAVPPLPLAPYGFTLRPVRGRRADHSG
jgi:hypothetical protein